MSIPVPERKGKGKLGHLLSTFAGGGKELHFPGVHRADIVLVPTLWPILVGGIVILLIL